MKTITVKVPDPIFFLLLALLPAIPCLSQDYLLNVRHYGVKEGLSHREIFTVHQDSHGFIWLGTKYGLNRFDGREFKWWTKEKNGLASNEILNFRTINIVNEQFF